MRKSRLAILSLVVLQIWLNLLFPFSKNAVTQRSAYPQFISQNSDLITSTSTVPVRSSSNQPPDASDTTNAAEIATIIAAIIGFLGVFVTGGFLIYQARQNAKLQSKLQKESLEYQRKNLEIQQQYQRELQNLQNQQERNLLRFQKELEKRDKIKEQNEQARVVNTEALRLNMLLAKTSEQRVQTYRKSLLTDPRIASLQILEMNRPLNMSDIYVRVRVHEETRLAYEIEPTLLEAEDPNALFKAGQMQLEKRSNSALNPDDAIRTYKRCIIVGDPGAGKTTLLKYLAINSVEQQFIGLPDIPIYIELNAFVSSGHNDLLDFAANTWDERYGFPLNEARAYMENVLREGKALFLLDALDETVIGESIEEAEESYYRAVNAIAQLATRYPQAPLVVTARKAGYHQRSSLAGFIELEILDFRVEDIRQFVANWFEYFSDSEKRANGTDLNIKLERNPRIQALAANPLLLSLIVLVYEAQLDLPDRRAELYKRCVDTLLSEWDAKRNIRRRREFKPEHKRQLLEEIAWHFHLQGRRYFPEHELLEVVASFLPAIGLPAEQNGRVLAEIAAEHGLLKEQAKGWYGFLHLTLQEYFVAQYVTVHNQLEILLSHLSDPWWEEVLLLYAGQTSDASPLLERLLGSIEEKTARRSAKKSSADRQLSSKQNNKGYLREDLFYTNLILAGRCLAAYPTIRQTSLREAVISQLFKILVETPYDLTKEQIADSLASIGGSEINSQMIRLIFEEKTDTSVRRSLIEALGKIGEWSIAPDLVRLIFDTKIDSSVRRSLAEALGKIGEWSIAPDLVRLIFDTKIDSPTRQSIMEALGQFGERTDTSNVAKMLTNEKLPLSIRRSMATAVAMLGEGSDLIQLLSIEGIDPSIRRNIAATLSRVRERSVMLSLVSLLSDEKINSQVRREIAVALGRLRVRSVAVDLVPLLSNEQINSVVRKEIAATLGKLRELSIVSDLMHQVSQQKIDISVRREIVVALGRLGEHSIISGLLEILKGETDPLLSRDVLIALGMLGETSVISELVKLLYDDKISISVRRDVAVILSSLRERSIAQQLVHMLSDERFLPPYRKDIALAIGQLGDQSVSSELVELLSQDKINKFVRRSIAIALSLLRDQSVVPELIQLLPNEKIDTYIRRDISEAISKLATPLAAPDLVKLLPDEKINTLVRQEIAVTLSRLGERSIVPDLVKLLPDEKINTLVRQEIAVTLSRLGERSIVPDLVKLLPDEKINMPLYRSIIAAIGFLANDEGTIQVLTDLLASSNARNEIYRAMWNISRRAKVRIYMRDKSVKNLEIIK